ncbi:MAG: lysine exporter LysO family protein [Clostridia bacterium]|jgi:hypothetical protein|uniref:Lysine exporter LysO family protein n=1 Tax=Bianquea renquensis TaxID=2763661 RepID=A0A926DSA6_9FIRM|nr:lysine exporter LysO family protein [Bianquea renquensis]MBC8542892.1 lysine exporter LysO family protein [Bianquea renquensis]
MVIAAIVSLILGVVCGQWLFSPDLVSLFGPISEYTLYILMFAVGISVGANKQVFRRLRQYHVKILIIPAGIVVGTVLAGFLCYLIVDMPLRDCLAVVCGLGWYSLSGVLLTNLAGATLGTMAFFSNLLREILSFLTIPFIAKHLNHYTAIAPAAATSEDTTLPLLMRCTSEDVAVMAVVNGVVCSALVPVILNLLYRV